MSSARRPVVIAAVCAVAALLMLTAGIGFRRDDPTGGADWKGRLEGLVKGQKLTAHDLLLDSGSCKASGQTIEIQGKCEFRVDRFGSDFAIEAVTKRAKATAVSGSTRIEVQIEGTRISHLLEEEKATDLTFGRAGGHLELQCVALGPCRLSLD